MLKLLHKNDTQTTPFVVTKNWELSNVINEDVILMEHSGSDGLPVGLEYVIFGPYFPITASGCDVALENQSADLANYRDGLKLSGIFYPDSDPQNIDGTYQRVVYSQVVNMFYNSYRDPTKIWGLEQIDFDKSKTKRFLSDKFKMFEVPQPVYGEKMIPNTVVMYDRTTDNDYVIVDDGNCNLFAGTNIFSHQQEVGEFNNTFMTGSNGYCNYYNTISPPDEPVMSLQYNVCTPSVTINWNINAWPVTDYVVEKSNDGITFSQIFDGLAFTYTDTAISYSGTYWYRMYAVNLLGTSSITPSASISASDVVWDTDTDSWDTAGTYCGPLYWFSGSTPIPPVTSSCVASPIPTQDMTGSIANTDPTSSLKPGSYTNAIPYSGTSGSVLNIFMKGAFNEYVILLDPDGIDVGESDYMSSRGAALYKTLEKTGNYTVLATTSGTGTTGNYRLRLSSGPIKTLTALSSSYPKTFSYNVGMAYATSSQYLFLGDQDTAIVSVLDIVNDSVVNFLDVTSSGEFNINNLVYGSGQDKVYATTYGSSATKHVQVISSAGVLGTNIDTTLSRSAYAYDICYNEVADKIAVVSGVSSANFVVIDCLTETVDFALTLPNVPNSVTYVNSVDSYYVSSNSAGIIYIVNATTHVVTTSALGTATTGNTIKYIKEVDKFLYRAASGVAIANPTTDTNVASLPFTQFEYAVFDPCSNEIKIVAYNDGMYAYETSSYALVNRWQNVGTGSFILNEGPAYADVNSSTYIIDRLNNTLYAIPMDKGVYLTPPSPPTGSVPTIQNLASVLAAIDPGSEALCGASVQPAWDGVFNNLTYWNGGTDPLYYFLSQSFNGYEVAANYAPDYPSGDWPNLDTFTQIYWYSGDSSWNLWIACTAGYTIWAGTLTGNDITNPYGVYTQSAGSATPATITIG